MSELDDAFYWFLFSDGAVKLGEIDQGVITLFDQTDPESHGEVVEYRMIEEPRDWTFTRGA